MRQRFWYETKANIKLFFSNYCNSFQSLIGLVCRGQKHRGLIFTSCFFTRACQEHVLKAEKVLCVLNLTHRHARMCKQTPQTKALYKRTVSPFKIIKFLPIQKSAWNSLRLQWLRKSEYKKKINIHVMPFKSLINIRSICPLAEIQRPVNANEWECKAIRVHYRVPLVSIAASLRLSTGRPCERQTHNSKILCPLNDRWETCAFCVSREKIEHKLIMEVFSISGRAALLLTNTFWGYLSRWSNYKQWWSKLVEIRSLTSCNCIKRSQRGYKEVCCQ